MVFADTPLFWTLLAAHLLGDFYFQSHDLAVEKAEHLEAALLHCLQYALCLTAVHILLWGGSGLQGVLWAAAGHAAIDLLKFHCREQLFSWPPARVFVLDQALHLAVLAATALLQPVPAEASPLSALLRTVDCAYEPVVFLRFCCLLLLLGKPVNVFLKVHNAKPAVGDGTSGAEYRRAGAIIGTLERFLTAILFLLGEYGAITVVFAAKTLTRYQKITSDPNFSEYYLIGTLESLLLAVVFTFLLFPPG